jgi:hypothetical protein
MKLNRLYRNLLPVLLAVLAIMFTACSKDDDSDSGNVVFEAFGPSPALRGGELTFIGKNLDKVTKIILPEGIEITDITVIDKEHIKVTIPQNAKVGYVKIVASGTEYTSKTLLTYTEPITIAKISPSPVKPGQTLTIEGDYLNLMSNVIFTDGVVVSSSSFVTWERGKIEVIVPEEAQTGVITLSDGAQIPLELKSEDEIEIVLPSVPAALDLTQKKPGDVITITGKDLDLVKEVLLPDGTSVDFTVDGDKITFTLPEGITDGAIVMVPASGVHVAIANIGVAVPSELVATPATGLKEGTVITIKGVNMDLVTTVTFPGVDTPVTPTSKSATEIKVTMPAAATSGDLTLNTASGKTATVAIETLKPEVLTYDPSSVAEGNTVVLNGKNFDLVASVTFAGDKTVAVTPTAADQLSVAVPVGSETGEVTLTMKNGETVKCPSLTITKPEFCYIPVLPGSDVEIKAGTILTVEVQNADKLTNVQVNGTTTQYILQGTTLYIFIPNNANGNTKVKLISSNGEVEYTVKVTGAGASEIVVWTGMQEVTWSDGGRVFVPISAFSDVEVGSFLKIYFTQKDAWGQLQINDGSWAQLPWIEIGGGTLTTDTYGDKSVSEQELVLTASLLQTIRDKVDGSGNAIIMQGSDWIVTKVSIVSKPATTISEETVDLGSWSNTVRLYKESFSGAKAGSTLVFSFTPTASNPQIKLQDANWTALSYDNDPNYDSQWNVFAVGDTSTSYRIVLTQAMLDQILSVDDGWSTTAIVVAGQNMIVKKVSLISR